MFNTKRIGKPEIQHRKFHFVDAMPGAGKTEYFVTRAIQLLSKGRADRALIYVAPTILLLKEALRRIAAHPGFKKQMERKITLVTTTNKIRRDDLPMRCVLHNEAPRKVINYLLGLSNSCGDMDKLPPTIQLGDLILTTHESFVQVNHRDPTGRDFSILRQCEVIFDEARHCVIEHRMLKEISNEHLILMSRAFAFHQAAFRKKGPSEKDPDISATAWHVYQLTDAQPVSKMKASFGVRNWTSIPRSIRKLHRDVSLFSDSGRASVFVMASVNPMELMAADTKDSRVSAYTLLRPTSLFNHYKDVTLTSAFFKDSHMYHFLKEDGHEFHDLRDSKRPELTSIYRRDRILRNALSKRLVVGVLMKENTSSYSKEDYRNNLTSNLLNNGMVIPAKIPEDKLNKSITMSKSSLPEIISALQAGDQVARSPIIQSELEKHAFPPLWILIKETARLIEHAWECGYIKRPKSGIDYHNLALLVLNVSRNLWSRKQVPYAAVVQALYSRGKLVDSAAIDEDFHTVYSKEERQMVDNTSKEWRRELARHLYIQSPEAKFVIPHTNKLHGINKYSELNAFAHLAALNPTPQLIAFYKVVLGPEYDIDQDHSIENLVQMLYRTSLRKVEAKSRVLMIVPYKAQAKLLQAKIGCDEFVYMNVPRLAQWHHRRVLSKADRVSMTDNARMVSLERRRLHLDIEDKRRLNSMRVSIHRFRKLISSEPHSPRVAIWKAKIADYESQIKAMVQK